MNVVLDKGVDLPFNLEVTKFVDNVNFFHNASLIGVPRPPPTFNLINIRHLVRHGCHRPFRCPDIQLGTRYNDALKRDRKVTHERRTCFDSYIGRQPNC